MVEEEQLYRDGIHKLMDLSHKVSDMYREIQEIITYFRECNSQSVLFDSFYLQELILKKDGLLQGYEQLLVQIWINNCLDMKSWKAGQYSYERNELESWVEEFNRRYDSNIHLEDVIKSLRFDYGMDINISRVER
jgi:hypothetical protein